MRHKVLISAALMANPEVLFLDEPLNGLDANAALVVRELLRELASQGRTILFCSHILEVVERICTRIIINEGRVITEGVPAEIATATGTTSLEAAFARITGVRDAADLSALRNGRTLDRRDGVRRARPVPGWNHGLVRHGTHDRHGDPHRLSNGGRLAGRLPHAGAATRILDDLLRREGHQRSGVHRHHRHPGRRTCDAEHGPEARRPGG